MSILVCLVFSCLLCVPVLVAWLFASFGFFGLVGFGLLAVWLAWIGVGICCWSVAVVFVDFFVMV